jgi:hypothetical protein
MRFPPHPNNEPKAINMTKTSELLADENALVDFIYEIQSYAEAKRRAAILWPCLSTPPSDVGRSDMAKLADDLWVDLERLLCDECGLRLDEGLGHQRPNLINAIRNTLSAQPDAAVLSAAVEFLSNGEGLHKIRVNGKMMDRKDVAAALRQSPSPGEQKLGSSEPLGPLYDGTTMDNQQLHGTTRRNQPVVTAGETATTPSPGEQDGREAIARAKAKLVWGMDSAKTSLERKTAMNDALALLSRSPAPGGGVDRTAVIEECAKVADDLVTYEGTVFDRADDDGALSETGRHRIQDRALARQMAGESIARKIRALAQPEQEAAPPPPSPPQVREADLNAAIEEIVSRVSEWDDRTSPEDWPEALLITQDELRDELREFAAALSTPLPEPKP